MRLRALIKIPSRTGDFVKNYRLPLWSTIGLFVVLALLLALRTYEKGIIAGVLGDKNSTSSDYARLLSKDAGAELKKNDTDAESNQTSAPSDTPTDTTTSLTIDSSGGGTTGNDSGTVPSNGGGGNVEPPVEPFSAQITGFGRNNQYGPFVCGSSGLIDSPGKLCKDYEFIAGVNTFNGPGTVNHKLSWRGVETGQMTGSYEAATGDAFKQVSYKARLKCDKPGLYSFKFIITQPGTIESHEIPIDHNCGSVSS